VTGRCHHVTVIPAFTLIRTTIGNITSHMALARVLKLSSRNGTRTGLIFSAGRRHR
jgi:hypothetical protein